VQSLKNAGAYYYLNPGSTSIPKNGNCHSYMIYENGVVTIKDLDGNPVGSLTL
jgi:predicted phosphodiesterase